MGNYPTLSSVFSGTVVRDRYKLMATTTFIRTMGSSVAFAAFLVISAQGSSGRRAPVRLKGDSERSVGFCGTRTPLMHVTGGGQTRNATTKTITARGWTTLTLPPGRYTVRYFGAQGSCGYDQQNVNVSTGQASPLDVALDIVSTGERQGRCYGSGHRGRNSQSRPFRKTPAPLCSLRPISTLSPMTPTIWRRS